MRNTIRYLSALTALLGAGFVLSTPAAAQEESPTITLSAPTTVSAAEQLELKAATPVENNNWAPAAADLVQAAKLRPAEDVVAVNDLLSAATLYASIDRPTTALVPTEEAAWRAERMGAADMAVRAWIATIKLAAVAQDDRELYFVNQLEVAARLPGVTPALKTAVLGALGFGK